MAGWSDEAKAATGGALRDPETLLLPGLAMKHWDGAFGLIDADDLVTGTLRIVDRRTGAESRFPDVAALVAAGWVID